jgi:hypothetical protein
LRNEEMKEIFDAIPTGAKVKILPWDAQIKRTKITAEHIKHAWEATCFRIFGNV